MKDVTDYERGYIEGAAEAAWKIAIKCGATELQHCKTYDPATVANGQIHSYVFDLADGGRHHDLKDYEDIHDVVRRFVDEATQIISKPIDAAE